MARKDEGDGSGRIAPSASLQRREAIRAAARRPARTLRQQGAADVRRGPAPMPVAAHDQPPEIFISYARHDLSIVRELVQRLRARGAVVTWDQDFTAGTDFEQRIREAIKAARCVIVVWSAASARSRFVRDEAGRALQADKLVTTHVDGFDFDEVPIGFGHLHAVPADDEALIAHALSGHGIELAA